MARVIGLISGTSADGVDAALVSVDGATTKRGRGSRAAAGARGPRVTLEAFTILPYPAALRARVLGVAGGAAVGAPEIAALDVEIGEIFAKAARSVAARAGVALGSVDAIGSHGQTIHHAPHARPPATMQIGDPHVIAERTGATVVADFRRRDVAAGGEGAPLVPVAHADLFRAAEARAIQNLGGIGNVTVLPPLGSRNEVFAFDTGPANMVLDALVRVFSGGRKRFDRGGSTSARGTPDEELLETLLRDPFFRRPPPKSTGREVFGRGYVAKLLVEARRRHLPPPDLLATAAELTARSIAIGYRRFVLPRARVAECVLCGGGVHNRDVVARIARALAPLGVRVSTTREHGVDPDAVEAIAFAMLAWDTLAGRPGNVPRATGARGPRVLGAVIPRTGG